MKIANALQSVQKLGIDTVAFIYLVEQHPDYLARIRKIFQSIQAGEIRGSSSVISLTEVLTKPLRTGRHDLAKDYRTILRNSRYFTLLPVTEEIAEEAASLRAQFGLKTPDALHAATAIKAGCDSFLTNDLGLTRITSIGMIILDELEL